VDAAIIRPGAFEPMALNVEFSGSGDELAAAITVPGAAGMRMEMSDLLISDEAFKFSFLEPGGTNIECSLIRLEDDSFRGECGSGGGDPVEMTIAAFEE
jgi:hypothetical protein